MTTLGIKQDKYRPKYHFTPPSQWMNDPNGLVFFDGEYHLFYQHHPDSTVWGPMNWGHAVSTDLIHWEHHPIALKPDHNGMVFSGSAVVDHRDTSGLLNGMPGLVAIFTQSNTDPEAVDDSGNPRVRQHQSLAYSTDKGRTWTMYEGNPVLSDSEIVDFRDPKVFWHDPSGQWVMVIAVGDHVRFYLSSNLREWSFASSFGLSEGSHLGVWECPDLFELPVDGNPDKRKWVLLVSIGDDENYPEGSRTQYFIGDFDGKVFKNDLSPDDVIWMDAGRDNYAGVTWSDIPEEDGRRLLIGWMSNWKYANLTPTETWRSAMTLPRVLTLRSTKEGIRLYQEPVKEVESLRSTTQSWSSVLVGSGFSLDGIEGGAYEVEAEFELLDAKEFGLKIRISDKEETVIGYVPSEEYLYIDRTHSGESTFHPSFAVKHGARLQPENNRIRIRLFVDWSNVEVFANDGLLVISDLIFPDPESQGFEVYAMEGHVKLNSLIFHSM